MAYSQGFNPRPRFQIAAALPVGVTGQVELLDVWLDEVLIPEQALARLRDRCASGSEREGHPRGRSAGALPPVANARSELSGCDP